jgi:hypothetical protein
VRTPVGLNRGTCSLSMGPSWRRRAVPQPSTPMFPAGRERSSWSVVGLRAAPAGQSPAPGWWSSGGQERWVQEPSQATGTWRCGPQHDPPFILCPGSDPAILRCSPKHCAAQPPLTAPAALRVHRTGSDSGSQECLSLLPGPCGWALGPRWQGAG